MDNIWFTSDPHFYHKNVIELCQRPFASLEEMHEELIRRWNERVQPDHKIFIIGDMFFCGVTKMKEIMSRLNGEKHLVWGNHDWKNIKRARAQEFGFASIEDHNCIAIGKTEDFAGTMALMCHFPYIGDHTGEDRFKDKRLLDTGRWLIHGHVHNAWKVRERQINVGVDQWDFRPVSLREIVEIIKTNP